MSEIRFFVPGKPEPAGSKQSFVPLNKKTHEPFRRANGGVVVSTVDANKKSKGWKQTVSFFAARSYSGPLLTGPIELRLTFTLTRPTGHWRTGKNSHLLRETAPSRPDKKPDALKLARAVEDALTQVIWIDDSQIVEEHISKVYGATPGCEIVVSQIATEDQPTPDNHRAEVVLTKSDTEWIGSMFGDEAI